jgi:phosphomannomutase
MVGFLLKRILRGYRVSCTNIDEKGWFLLRLSLHDPVLPLNVESEVIGGVKNIAVKLCDFLKKFEKYRVQFFE